MSEFEDIFESDSSSSSSASDEELEKVNDEPKKPDRRREQALKNLAKARAIRQQQVAEKRKNMPKKGKGKPIEEPVHEVKSGASNDGKLEKLESIVSKLLEAQLKSEERRKEKKPKKKQTVNIVLPQKEVEPKVAPYLHQMSSIKKQILNL